VNEGRQFQIAGAAIWNEYEPKDSLVQGRGWLFSPGRIKKFCRVWWYVSVQDLV